MRVGVAEGEDMIPPFYEPRTPDGPRGMPQPSSALRRGILQPDERALDVLAGGLLIARDPGALVASDHRLAREDQREVQPRQLQPRRPGRGDELVGEDATGCRVACQQIRVGVAVTELVGAGELVQRVSPEGPLGV